MAITAQSSQRSIHFWICRSQATSPGFVGGHIINQGDVMILFSALMFACSDEEEQVEEPAEVVDSAQEEAEPEDSAEESEEAEE